MCVVAPCDADADVAQLDTVVTAFVFGAQIDFPLKQKNACRALTNAECPLDRFESVTYKFELDVDKSYPSVSVSRPYSLDAVTRFIFRLQQEFWSWGKLGKFLLRVIHSSLADRSPRRDRPQGQERSVLHVLPAKPPGRGPVLVHLAVPKAVLSK